VVLARTVRLDLVALSVAGVGDCEVGQPEGRDLVGPLQTDGGPVRVSLLRPKIIDEALEWRFARRIVVQLDELYEEFGGEPALAQHLPPVLYQYQVFGTELWQ
jgi:hypothetical protein